MKITFWGAAGSVTGSMHLVESNGKRVLLDCGLNQGRRQDAERKNRNLPVGSTIDAVVLSHAHIDHSGNLPTLVKGGFAGPIYTTPATIDLCNWMLRDTAHIHEKDAEFLNKRREHRRAAGMENRHVIPTLHHGGRGADPAAVSCRPLPSTAISGRRPDLHGV